MQIVIAPDSFKECLSAARVCEAITAGILRIVPNARITSVPVADGGEGSVEALVKATGGHLIPTPSFDALNRPISSFYGVLGNQTTAVIEMAAASGIELIQPRERNPLLATTFGTGLLIKAALEAGYTDLVMAIGGSATNDGGAGMAQALGARLTDANGLPLPPGGGSLHLLHEIDLTDIHPLLRHACITVACDVQNPLTGPTGATMVYGPQKGATPAMIEILEKGLQHFSQILQQHFNIDVSNIPGAGAAGGLGAGLMTFCRARLTPGFELISRLTHLEETIRKAELVFTAEGKIDAQTAYGKTVSGVARLCQKHHLPLIALAAIVEDNLDALYQQGVTAIFPIADRPMSLQESTTRAAELLSITAEQIMRMGFHSPLSPPPEGCP